MRSWQLLLGCIADSIATAEPGGAVARSVRPARARDERIISPTPVSSRETPASDAPRGDDGFASDARGRGCFEGRTRAVRCERGPLRRASAYASEGAGRRTMAAKVRFLFFSPPPRLSTRERPCTTPRVRGVFATSQMSSKCDKGGSRGKYLSAVGRIQGSRPLDFETRDDRISTCQLCRISPRSKGKCLTTNRTIRSRERAPDRSIRSRDLRRANGGAAIGRRASAPTPHRCGAPASASLASAASFSVAPRAMASASAALAPAPAPRRVAASRAARRARFARAPRRRRPRRRRRLAARRPRLGRSPRRRRRLRRRHLRRHHRLPPARGPRAPRRGLGVPRPPGATRHVQRLARGRGGRPRGPPASARCASTSPCPRASTTRSTASGWSASARTRSSASSAPSISSGSS